MLLKLKLSKTRIGNMKRETITLDKIFLKDERYRISHHFSLEKLIISLREIGLVHPPLLSLQDHRLILVSGWKRVLACLELSLSPLEVYVTEERDDLRIFLAALYENLATREFSLVEKSEILGKLEKFGEKKERIVKYYMPLLNIPPTPFYLDLFLGLSQFEPELKKAIHEKTMPLSTVQMLAEFASEERKLLFPLLLPLSQNKQRELLDDVGEVSRKNDIPVREILGAKDIQEILNSTKFSALQKSEKTRVVLKKKRYPFFSSWKEAFDSSLRKIHWPKEISIKPSPFFEDRNISLTFNFRNKREFEANLSKLQEIASRKEFPEMFRLPSSV